ncbi:MAG: hypothetical protein IT578_12020 [Verrucomicrobiae bacterium]|nr:hypothetical protein [Verrucomicrobiae bacterium]
MASIGTAYYGAINSARTSLDIKVKSPWPAQCSRRPKLQQYFEPEHVLLRKAKAGVICRLICLEPESYREFCLQGSDKMANSPYFAKAQAMIDAFEQSGGSVRRISGAIAPELSFVIVDAARAVLFLGAWDRAGRFQREPFQIEDLALVEFLKTAFEICWTAR